MDIESHHLQWTVGWYIENSHLYVRIHGNQHKKRFINKHWTVTTSDRVYILKTINLLIKLAQLRYKGGINLRSSNHNRNKLYRLITLPARVDPVTQPWRVSIFMLRRLQRAHFVPSWNNDPDITSHTCHNVIRRMHIEIKQPNYPFMRQLLNWTDKKWISSNGATSWIGIFQNVDEFNITLFPENYEEPLKSHWKS